MSENENVTPEQPLEQTELDLTPAVGDAPAEEKVAVDETLPAPLREVDPSILAGLRDKLKNFVERQGKTVSGSEDPDSAPTGEGAPATDEEGRPLGQAMSGKDVDWSEYDLDFSVRHLYERATFRQTPQGPKWVAMLDEFYSTERDLRNHGKKVNVPGSSIGEQEHVNLGEYLTDMVNGHEGWSIASVMPGSMGKAGVLLRKQSAVMLPDPQPLRRTEEVEAPKPADLKQIEDAALAFAAEEGLTPPAIEEDTQSGEAVVEPQPQGEDLSGRFLSMNEAIERGASLPQTSALVSAALARAQGETLDAPAPEQPEAIETGRVTPLTPKGKLAPGLANIIAGLPEVMKQGDFGDVK